jgi:hypothetical protein
MKEEPLLNFLKDRNEYDAAQHRTAALKSERNRCY